MIILGSIENTKPVQSHIQEDATVPDATAIQSKSVQESQSIIPEESSSEQTLDTSLPAKGDGGRILAASENIAVVLKDAMTTDIKW